MSAIKLNGITIKPNISTKKRLIQLEQDNEKLQKKIVELKKTLKTLSNKVSDVEIFVLKKENSRVKNDLGYIENACHSDFYKEMMKKNLENIHIRRKNDLQKRRILHSNGRIYR